MCNIFFLNKKNLLPPTSSKVKLYILGSAVISFCSVFSGTRKHRRLAAGTNEGKRSRQTHSFSEEFSAVAGRQLELGPCSQHPNFLSGEAQKAPGGNTHSRGPAHRNPDSVSLGWGSRNCIKSDDCEGIRMAEWSKAPDSSSASLLGILMIVTVFEYNFWKNRQF